MNYELVDLLLKLKGMSRRQLALACGIAPGTMANWFARQTKNIPFKHIQSIAKVLDKPWYKILGVDSVEEYNGEQIAFVRIPEDFINGQDSPRNIDDRDGRFLYTQVSTQNANETEILLCFRDINDEGQKKALETVKLIARIPEFRNKKRKKE